MKLLGLWFGLKGRKNEPLYLEGPPVCQMLFLFHRAVCASMKKNTSLKIRKQSIFQDWKFRRDLKQEYNLNLELHINKVTKTYFYIKKFYFGFHPARLCKCYMYVSNSGYREWSENASEIAFLNVPQPPRFVFSLGREIFI